MSVRILAAAAAFMWATSAYAQSAPPISMPGYPAVGGKAIVTVISPGTNAKPLPRQAPVAGLNEHMNITMGMAMSMEIAGSTVTPPAQPPPITMGLDLGVTNVAANGDVTVSMAFTGVTMDGPSPDAAFDQVMRNLGEQLKTFKGSMTVGADGHVVSQDINFPSTPAMSADAAKNFADSLRNMTPPIPETPIGLGGRWEVRAALQSGGAVMFQKMEYEVVAIDGASVTVKVANEQTLPPQSVANPQLPPGAEMFLESGSGSGKGTITFTAGSLVPSSEVAMKSSLRFRVSMNGETQPLGLTTDVKVKIKKG
jgi:hypothetical protein